MKKLSLTKVRAGFKKEVKEIREDMADAAAARRWPAMIDLEARLDVFDYLLSEGVLEEYLVD